jgi:hypothetical protein
MEDSERTAMLKMRYASESVFARLKVSSAGPCLNPKP